MSICFGAFAFRKWVARVNRKVKRGLEKDYDERCIQNLVPCNVTVRGDKHYIPLSAYLHMQVSMIHKS